MSKQVINIVVLLGGTLENVETFETEDRTMIGQPGDNIKRIEQRFIDLINEQFDPDLTETETQNALDNGYFEIADYQFFN